LTIVINTLDNDYHEFFAFTYRICRYCRRSACFERMFFFGLVTILKRFKLPSFRFPHEGHG
jgi:hypothetical protein